MRQGQRTERPKHLLIKRQCKPAFQLSTQNETSRNNGGTVIRERERERERERPIYPAGSGGGGGEEDEPIQAQIEEKIAHLKQGQAARRLRRICLSCFTHVHDVLNLLYDIFTSKSSFANYISARDSQLLGHRKIEHGLSFIWNKQIGFGSKNHIQIPKRSMFGRLSIDKKDEHIINAVATVEPTSVPTANDEMCTATLEYGDCQVSQFSHEDSPDIDDREKLRRMRISKANKGNVPWNKGRKHSQETLQRIRERTKLAMQDPKVKMKLVNLGHAQSEETRLKIGMGVREGWQRRREKLTVQEGCCIEWQNAIAEAARNGLAGEEELHWDSYKVLDEQLMQEWLESVERRKTMPRLKGSKRAPKSPEQRRKISESISAKWADPGYRERVCSALAKYHGTPIGAERRRRRKPPTQTAVNKESVIKKPMQPKSSSTETKITKNTSKKKNSTPSYKDPMASTKLEMIKKIKVQRAALEARKKDAIERAKLLITEAEKAAKALEMAALKSPIARASLLETRKLIAKATKSIEGINHGQVPMQDTAEDISSDSAMSERSPGSQNCEDVADERLINGEVHLFSSDNGSCKDFEKSTLQVVLNGRELSWVSDSAGNSTEVFHHYHSPSSESESERKEASSINLLTGSSTVNGSIAHNKIIPAGGDESLRINKDEVSTSATKIKLKWACGKLVEVEED